MDDNPLSRGPKAICDESGFEFPLKDLVKRWDGMLVHPRFWEPQQPQDFVRGVPDNMALPYSRPEAPDVFVGFNEVTRDDL